VRSIVLVLLTAAVCLSGCRKKPDPVVEPQLIDSGGVVANDGHLEIVFENMVGSQVLQLNAQTYTNEAGNSFTVETYKYYITNIKLWRADSTFYTEPESYHLINEEISSSKTILIHEVPKGEYTAITFMIGVDFDRNTSGAQTGALDPVNAMFWDWNSGYIMAKIQGTAVGIPGGYSFHIGGFEGKDGVLRLVTRQLPVAANVTGTGTPEIHIKSDVLEWFKTPVTIDFNTHSFVGSAGEDAAEIADNYADMFTVTHVEN
jgi:hypothetical protein